MEPATPEIAPPISSSPIGYRIHVIGSSSSGKSTLAARLAKTLDANFVELDALNWLPDWVGLNETNPEELVRRFQDATQGDAWVVAGSYSTFSQRSFWEKLDTVIWLDLPMLVLLKRMLVRSWRRSRSGELLWGTNVENFWKHFKVWRSDSLIYWIVGYHAHRRRQRLGWMTDPRWSHIRFIRLVSQREVDAFTTSVEDALNPPADKPSG